MIRRRCPASIVVARQAIAGQFPAVTHCGQPPLFWQIGLIVARLPRRDPSRLLAVEPTLGLLEADRGGRLVRGTLRRAARVKPLCHRPLR